MLKTNDNYSTIKQIIDSLKSQKKTSIMVNKELDEVAIIANDYYQIWGFEEKTLIEIVIYAIEIKINNLQSPFSQHYILSSIISIVTNIFYLGFFLFVVAVMLNVSTETAVLIIKADFLIIGVCLICHFVCCIRNEYLVHELEKLEKKLMILI